MKLTIPENIPLRWELFRGIGVAELLRAVAIMAVVMGGVGVYCLVSTAPMRVLTAVVIVLLAAAVCGGVFAKQQHNLSMYDYIRLSIRFGHTQKRYVSQPEELYYAETET